MLQLVLDGEEVRLVTDDANAELIIMYDAFGEADIDPLKRAWFDGADAFDFEDGVVIPEEELNDVLDVIEGLDVPGASETAIKLREARKGSPELSS